MLQGRCQVAALVSDLLSLGPVLLRLPHTLRYREPRVHLDSDRGTGHHPVLLIHGYAGSDAVWNALVAGLQRAGFDYVIRLSYNWLSGSLADLVRCCAEQVAEAIRQTGAPGVHLIGHSLGGLLARYAAHHLPPPGATSVVTIAAPHGGLPLARLAPGSLAELMQRGYPLPTPDCRVPVGSQWVAFYSDADRLVPPSAARLDEPRFGATNILVPSRGHLTICRDSRLIDGVVRELVRIETAGRGINGSYQPLELS